MRKIYYAAALAAMVGCAQFDLEDVAVAETPSSTGTSVSVSVACGDATRVAVDTDAWTTSWESGDALAAVGAEASSVLTMSEFGADVSIFKGALDESITDYRLFYPETLVSETGSVVVSYASVEAGCQAPAMVSSDLLVASDDLDTDSSDDPGETVSMMHIGAAMDVQVTFTGLPSSASSYSLSTISLNSNTASVNNKATMTYGADVESEVVYTAGDIVVSGISQSVVKNTAYSVKFSIMPFEVAAGESIDVEFTLLGSDGNTYIQSETLTAGVTTSFARATYNYLSIKTDMSSIQPTYRLFEGETLQLTSTTMANSIAESIATVDATGLVTAVSTGVTQLLIDFVTVNIEVVNVVEVGDYYYANGVTISCDEYLNSANSSYNAGYDVVGVLVEANPITGVGLVVSLPCDTYQWSTDVETTVGSGITDGVAFMAAVQELDPTFATYPAFGFCDGLNQTFYGDEAYEYIEGSDYIWYVPTNAQLGNISMIYHNNVDNWNTWFASAGGTEWPSHGTTADNGTHYWNITGSVAANAKYTRLGLAGAYVSYSSAKTAYNRVRCLMSVKNIVVPEREDLIKIPDLVESESGIVAQ